MKKRPRNHSKTRSGNQGADTVDHFSVLQQLRQQLEIYELIFNSIHNGAMVTDAFGYVTHFNQPYGRFLGLEPSEQIGRHCTEVLENTRMHIVAKTGKAEINRTHEVNGQNMVVQRIPMCKNGEVIAVFGQVMFKDVSDVHKLAREFSLLESKVQHYEEELINLRATRYTLDSIIGKSDAMAGLKKEALRAAGSRSPVLVSGESGTGKELFAESTAPPFPRTCWSRSFSATKKALSPVLIRGAKRENSSWPTGAPFFWMKSGTCPWRCSPSYCASLRTGLSSAWGATKFCAPIFD